LSFYEGVGVLKIKDLESESEVLKIEVSESELLCTDSTALVVVLGFACDVRQKLSSLHRMRSNINFGKEEKRNAI
jgi:hypothetical protein